MIVGEGAEKGRALRNCIVGIKFVSKFQKKLRFFGAIFSIIIIFVLEEKKQKKKKTNN